MFLFVFFFSFSVFGIKVFSFTEPMTFFNLSLNRHLSSIVLHAFPFSFQRNQKHVFFKLRRKLGFYFYHHEEDKANLLTQKYLESYELLGDLY